jgi:hypothetical protein
MQFQVLNFSCVPFACRSKDQGVEAGQRSRCGGGARATGTAHEQTLTTSDIELEFAHALARAGLAPQGGSLTLKPLSS